MKKLTVSVLLILVVLGGCGYIGQPQPETPKQALLAADRNFTAVVASANSALENGTISDTQARKITPYINSGDRLLDAAWSAYRAGKTDLVMTKVNELQSIIMDINAVLNKKEGVSP